MKFRRMRNYRGVPLSTVGGVGLTVSRRGAAAFTPALVSGYLGGIYAGPARSAGLLWQDSGESTPATADTDPAYVAGDPYSATEMRATSDANRLILTAESGGKWSAKGNGTSSFLATGFAGMAGEFCLYAAVAVGGSGASLLALFGNQTPATFIGWYPDGHFYAIADGGFVGEPSTPATAVVRVRRDAAGKTYFRFGGSAEIDKGAAISGLLVTPASLWNWPASGSTDPTSRLAGLALYDATPGAGDDADLMTFFGGLLPS